MSNEMIVARKLHDSSIIIGTYIGYIEIIDKVCRTDRLRDLFDPIRLSLQTSIIIETFKIFDNNGKDTRNNNIRFLFSKLNDDISKKYKREYSAKFDNFEKSIRDIRNKVVAHNISTDSQDILFNSNIKISDFYDFLKFVSTVCYTVDNDLIKACSSKNVKSFSKFMVFISEVFA